MVFFEWNALAAFEQVINAVPKDYSFWLFSAEQPWAWICNRPAYSLTRLPAAGPSGVANVLAGPQAQLPKRLRRCQAGR
ncbi:hypothetical protein [Synechococcus sp. HK05]|uniref:hypothetical protein n=1 Tax=Synechococcus sp. HK05 TaxID=2725975 RepID=UPI0020CB2A9F|nr:hypothetical protein [Synechococcus sp. HK05]